MKNKILLLMVFTSLLIINGCQEREIKSINEKIFLDNHGDWGEMNQKYQVYEILRGHWYTKDFEGYEFVTLITERRDICKEIDVDRKTCYISIKEDWKANKNFVFKPGDIIWMNRNNDDRNDGVKK